MFSPCRVWLSGEDYRVISSVSDAFHNVLQRSGWAFDHVAVDVSAFAAVAGRMTRDLVGNERDAEATRIILRQIQGTVLRRIQARKSLAFFVSGSEPLWRIQRARRYPPRHYDTRFYRSAASPMSFQLEEKLCQLGGELRERPMEMVVSGPGTPGPAAGKLSAWMLDLASRAAIPSQLPSRAASVTTNDTVCLIGDEDLLMNAVGSTPFHNVTVVTLNQGEMKSFSLQDGIKWLRLDEVNPGEAAGAASASGVESTARPASGENLVAQKRIAAARTDSVLLYLMAHGISSTDLIPLSSVDFGQLMDAYLHLSNSSSAKESDDRCFAGYLMEEHPVTAEAPDVPSLRLRASALLRLLLRATNTTAVPPRRVPAAANYLEHLLQTHAMFCAGGLTNLEWIEGDIGGIMDKKPKLTADQLQSHLSYLIATATKFPEATTTSMVGGCVVPTCGNHFALTPLESLLMSAPTPEMMEQILPLYLRGHRLPAGLAKEISENTDVREALTKVRSVLNGVNRLLPANNSATSHTQDDSASAPHAALTHQPSHYYVLQPSSSGPPVGWSYHSVNLGLRSKAVNTRYSMNSSSALAPQVHCDDGQIKKNVLYTFSADEMGRWVESSIVNQESTSESSPPSTLSVLTWNVQFDRYSGETTPLGRPGISWCTPTRYLALNKVLEESKADVIAMQEVEPSWCAFLQQQPWVQENYAMTSMSTGPAIQPWGVLLLVRKSLHVVSCVHGNLPAYSGHASAMPEVQLRLSPEVPPLTIGAFHLLAPYSANNANNRETQLKGLLKRLPTYAASILMGDFNDGPENQFIPPTEMGYQDAWTQVHDNEPAEDGYTICGKANPYAERIIEPQFYGRADRILCHASFLRPVHAERVGTQPVRRVLGGEEAAQTLKLVERPAEDIPEYLFPSDHFGVKVVYQVL